MKMLCIPRADQPSGQTTVCIRENLYECRVEQRFRNDDDDHHDLSVLSKTLGIILNNDNDRNQSC